MEHICYSLLRLKMLSEIFCFLYCKIYGNNYILSVILKSDFFKKLFSDFFTQEILQSAILIWKNIPVMKEL